MAFLSSLDIVGSALTAQRYRSDVILQNIANARTTRTAAGGPYRRKQVVFEERPLSFRESLDNARSRYSRTSRSGGVRIEEMVDSTNELKPVYEPEHPDADADGYVWYPNVDTTEEMVDLMAASTSYDSNLAALAVVKAMISKSLEMGA
jgi:flagellar basal-body rod protein FlgC